ncbi:hypothetical protein [Mucilaginibacter agri]|uniref:Uncharacterized protein n=1 Tax=Mucilaginibacter agri TaxID=2695265 RepID=A0A965ZEV7_9SPHI|nr:hypothetical protein [Mucilaginibacter agri]NCD69440.1 hypothetical protein [Mucilaginibacter agri]
MNVFKPIGLFIAIGFLVNYCCVLLQSDFLANFLHAQIITLTITLVAITSAVRGVILGKLTDLSNTFDELDFTSTFKELKKSILEQVSMVGIAIVLLTINSSKRLSDLNKEYFQFFTDSLLISILFYNIYILCDTGIAIINIFQAIATKSKDDS